MEDAGFHFHKFPWSTFFREHIWQEIFLAPTLVLLKRFPQYNCLVKNQNVLTTNPRRLFRLLLRSRKRLLALVLLHIYSGHARGVEEKLFVRSDKFPRASKSKKDISQHLKRRSKFSNSYFLGLEDHSGPADFSGMLFESSLLQQIHMLV